MTLTLDSMMTSTLAPIRVGPVVIDPPITLAPMAQVTTHVFRRLTKTLGGCGLVCTELLSSKAIHFRNQKTLGMLQFSESERPFAVQLFGAEPAVMAEAAQIVADLGADVIDINMGCWVPKVVGTGAGAALLKDVCTATAVVEAVVKAVSIPVTVKIRVGFSRDNLTGIPFARAAEQCGVQLIAVHGRTADQGFSGVADWETIRQIKALVSIPILGNGDITTPQDAARMFRETGVDGVMIGRAAIGNPWIFRQIEHYLKTGQELPDPSHRERIDMARTHARLTVKSCPQGERYACSQLRGQLPPFLSGLPGKRGACDALKHANTLLEIEGVLMRLELGLEG